MYISGQNLSLRVLRTSCLLLCLLAWPLISTDLFILQRSTRWGALWSSVLGGTFPISGEDSCFIDGRCAEGGAGLSDTKGAAFAAVAAAEAPPPQGSKGKSFQGSDFNKYEDKPATAQELREEEGRSSTRDADKDASSQQANDDEIFLRIARDFRCVHALSALPFIAQRERACL